MTDNPVGPTSREDDQGSAWDIGAPVANRGANLADSNLADSSPATGDLASRMVLPAFYRLVREGLLPKAAEAGGEWPR